MISPSLKQLNDQCKVTPHIEHVRLTNWLVNNQYSEHASGCYKAIARLAYIRSFGQRVNKINKSVNKSKHGT